MNEKIITVQLSQDKPQEKNLQKLSIKKTQSTLFNSFYIDCDICSESDYQHEATFYNVNFSSFRVLVVCVGDMIKVIPGTEDGWESVQNS